MRRFNLKGTVIQRMKGIEREEETPKKAEGVPAPEQETLNPGFSEEQGRMICAWRTDVGRIRKNNQDALIVGSGLVGVADGMGGHKGGEIASAGLRDGLILEITGKQPDPEILQDAVKTVNLALWEQQENDLSLRGMGTTMTVLWPSETEMIIGQVGDSRAYLLRDDEMTQVTEDHSMVADMVRKGVLTEEQAACHPMRNYITRAVGTEAEVQPDISVHDRKKGDRWLVCSDGLHGMISKTELYELLKNEDPETAAEQLLQAALAGGGRDNISLIILQDETDGLSPAAACPDSSADAQPEDADGTGEPAASDDPDREVTLD